MAEIAQYAYRSFTDRLRNDKLIGDIDPAGLLAPAYALRLAESNATGAEDNPMPCCPRARLAESLLVAGRSLSTPKPGPPGLADADKFYEDAATNCPT